MHRHLYPHVYALPLLTTLYISLNLSLRRKPDGRADRGCFFVTLAGFMTQYYFLIIACFIALFFCVWRLVRRRYAALVTHAVVVRRRW